MTAVFVVSLPPSLSVYASPLGLALGFLCVCVAAVSIFRRP